MKWSNGLVQRGAVAAVVALAGTFSGRASVDMTLVGVGLSATDVGGSAPAPLNISFSPGADYIGLYQFQISSSETSAQLSGTPFTPGETFYSVCLSPSGVLDWSTHSYDYDTFAQAASGLNPSNPNYTLGIQNAMYLWAQLGSSVTTGVEGAGLAEAMYAAYYNSTANGVLGNKYFTPLWGSGSTDAQKAYNSDIAYLEANGPTGIGPGFSGFMLVPDPSDVDGSGQEFVVLAPASPNITAPVPEATTLIAGALLLLPLGASTLRILRRRCIA